ncbi:MAG: TetR/AcrR family transcriptional regulator [Archangium sp.]|nr:TetR/AcrR family transcriptional regulator [Archangium sp.]
MSKQIAILEGATRLFLRHGFRKASMDEIAREAGVSKPTLYAYLADKDALFAAVCDHVGQKMLAAANEARSTKTFVERVQGILTAKFTGTYELLQQSPYAQELMDTQQAAARERIDATTAGFEALLLKEIDRAARAHEVDLRALGLDKRGLVRVLMQAGHGAAYGVRTVDEHREQLSTLVRAILRPGR